MKLRLELLVIFILIVAFCFAIVSSYNWEIGPQLYAWSTSLAGLGLTSAFFIRQVRSRCKSGGIAKIGIETKTEIAKSIKFFGWVIALTVTIWLFGFEVSIFLFVLSYVKLHRGSWLVSITVSMLVALTVCGLFDKVLNLAWVSGFVPQIMIR
jgi:hypothetical protein